MMKQGKVVKYQEERQEGKDPENAATEGSRVSIQVGTARIMGKEEGWCKRMGRVGRESEEEEDGYRQFACKGNGNGNWRLEGKRGVFFLRNFENRNGLPLWVP